MLQKLDDFWTYKDWEVLQKNASRPIFGPLRRVKDSSSDKKPLEECLNKTVVSSARLSDGSGERVKDVLKSQDCAAKLLASKKHLVTSGTPQIEQNVEYKVAPGWFNVQEWTEKFERDFKIPTYTGCCISYQDYNDHLSSRASNSRYQSADVSVHNHDIYWQEESYYRSSQDIQKYYETNDVRSMIDSDIAELASELLKADSVVAVAHNIASKLDCPQWIDRINSNRTMYSIQPPKTREVELSSSETIVVNIVETNYPLLLNKPVSNTKTPSHTPELPVQRQNTFSQIPYSTRALLDRSFNKINFLSSKQMSEPNQPLFRPKSECDVNFANFWDCKTESFKFYPSYDKQTTLSTMEISNPYSFPATSLTLVSEAVNRKRKQPCDIVQPAAKRINTGSGKKLTVTKTSTTSQSDIDLFAAPLFIPSAKQNTHAAVPNSVKNNFLTIRQP